MYNNYYFTSNTNGLNIVTFARGDVNGDKIPDNIYLIGIKKPPSPFVQDITLIIQDGFTGHLTSIPLEQNMGYDPNLLLADFTGNGIYDILISINSGGSGGIMYYYIYSFENNTVQILFDFNVYNNEYKYKINYENNYKVEAISEKNKEKYIIDITNKGPDYLNEIYDKNGKLKKPIEGFVNPLSGLFPIDFNSDNVYELLAYQKIAGRYNADGLGYFLNTLKWSNNNFILDNQNVAIWGANLK